jgi:hypothetical protein
MLLVEEILSLLISFLVILFFNNELNFVKRMKKYNENKYIRKQTSSFNTLVNYMAFYTEVNKREYLLKEFDLLGEERRHLEETQLKYLSMTIAAVALLFAYAATSTKDSPIIWFVFLIPTFLIIPTWFMFTTKAIRMTYLQGYEQLLESYLLNRVDFDHYGFENTLKGIVSNTFRNLHNLNSDFVGQVYHNIQTFRSENAQKFMGKQFLDLNEFGNLLIEDPLKTEETIKKGLGYISWNSRENGYFYKYLWEIFRPGGRTGTYWTLIFKVCFLLTVASIVLSLATLICTKDISGISLSLYSINISLIWPVGIIFILLALFVYGYLIYRMTAMQYELHKGIFSYDSNYDLWCVVLSAKPI